MTSKEIQEILLKNDSQYVRDHLTRIVESLQFLKENISVTKETTCIDTASSTLFTDILARLYSERSIESDLTNWDLRYPFPVDSSKYDLALSMEVFEHIIDRDSDEREWVAAWTYTGVLNYLCEMNRVLKTGGYFFLTTPNFGTLRTIYKLLGHDCPMFFNHHVKEYTINEVKELLSVTGFNVLICTTKQVWNYTDIHVPTAEKIKKFCAEVGYNISNRGDDIFILAQKASEPQEILFKSDYFTITKSYLFEEQFKPRFLR